MSISARNDMSGALSVLAQHVSRRIHLRLGLAAPSLPGRRRKAHGSAGDEGGESCSSDTGPLLGAGCMRVGRWTAAGTTRVVAASAAESGAKGEATASAGEENALEQEMRGLTSISEQLGVGGVLGLATGYSIRKLGRMVAFLVGTQICVLQYLAWRQWLVMDWRRVAHDLKPRMNRSLWQAGVDIVLYKMPFATAFSAGMAAGLRMSR